MPKLSGKYENIVGMAERRQADRTILVRAAGNPATKIEIFDGALFAGKTFTDVKGNPLNGERENLYRLRVDGKWYPDRRKILYQKPHLNSVLMKMIGE